MNCMQKLNESHELHATETGIAEYTAYILDLCMPPGDPNPARHAELVGSIPSQWAFSPNYAHSFHVYTHTSSAHRWP